MPTYEYQCTECGSITELYHGINENPAGKCPKCGGEFKKKISGGSGFIMKEGASLSCGKESTCCGRGTPCGKSSECRSDK